MKSGYQFSKYILFSRTFTHTHTFSIMASENGDESMASTDIIAPPSINNEKEKNEVDNPNNTGSIKENDDKMMEEKEEGIVNVDEKHKPSSQNSN